MTVTCTRWLDAFVGASLTDNLSSDPLFSYVKPLAYGGLIASFAAL